MKMAPTIIREIAAEITRRSGECFFVSFVFWTSGITACLQTSRLRASPYRSGARTTSGRALAPASR
jgi:hypothetical protein